MKPNKLIPALIAAALLPALAHAGTVSAGMEHKMYCEASSIAAINSEAAKADPVENEVNALVNSTSDPILLSYYRDLYRTPASYEAVKFTRTPDPYMDAISIALWGRTERGATHIC